MMMSNEETPKLIPIYTSLGDWGASLVYPNLYNLRGEWIGWITPERDVFDVDGVYVGWLTDEPRVLRKPMQAERVPRRTPPSPARRIRPPARVPLSPMLRELLSGTIDVLLDEPERLHTTDTGEMKEDMD